MATPITLAVRPRCTNALVRRWPCTPLDADAERQGLNQPDSVHPANTLGWLYLCLGFLRNCAMSSTRPATRWGPARCCWKAARPSSVI
jgi:hypothetical protein